MLKKTEFSVVSPQLRRFDYSKRISVEINRGVEINREKSLQANLFASITLRDLKNRLSIIPIVQVPDPCAAFTFATQVARYRT